MMCVCVFQSRVDSDPPAGLLLSSQTFTAETSNTTTTTHITKVTRVTKVTHTTITQTTTQSFRHVSVNLFSTKDSEVSFVEH